MKNSRGFTLIELLVVIAIIGILSSVVLTSLSSARNRAKDARVISDVQQLRTQIESDAASGNYNSSFSAADTLVGTGNYGVLTADATANGGTITSKTNATAPFSAYAIYGQLPSQSTATYFCIDSTGKTNPAASAKTTVVCP